MRNGARTHQPVRLDAMNVYAAGYFPLCRVLTGSLISVRGLPNSIFFLANGTLISASIFWITVAFQEPGTLSYVFSYSLLAISAVFAGISAFLFVYNPMMTIKR